MFKVHTKITNNNNNNNIERIYIFFLKVNKLHVVIYI